MVINGIHNDTQRSSGSLEKSTLCLNASYLYLVLNIFMLETCSLVSKVGFLPKFQSCFQVPLRHQNFGEYIHFHISYSSFLIYDMHCLSFETLLPQCCALGNSILILHDALPEPLPALDSRTFSCPVSGNSRVL